MIARHFYPDPLVLQMEHNEVADTSGVHGVYTTDGVIADMEAEHSHMARTGYLDIPLLHNLTGKTTLMLNSNQNFIVPSAKVQGSWVLPVLKLKT